ncbi:hypothetical protein Skr01_50620 [Sphaerisporangium krabiense]|uniref:Putative Tic20 family protein n=1 Tax=Sphaerisporangium krabiense TaxID=763782 RepID=A0A7W8Z9Y0_9ACTN|nr:DUF1707 and DUF4870 domain-containing protein [Sphaerisporangium krabiense]MBB5630030.1 putative Tic20 family protein [Sphaerisporangium krabiense]GII64977.1 hypothetical protein Skr01_50620 [Sphaerisporangium krabiense]
MTNDDRDGVVELVTSAYAEGRLSKDEFDERLHRAMTARVHGDLAPIVADLNAVPSVPPPPMPPAWPGQPRSWPGHGYAAPPTGNERLGAAAAHLLPLCGLFFVGPLIMLLTGGRRSAYIRRHAIEALNFHLTVLGATLLLPFTVIGIVLIPFIWILAFVLSIVGGAAALGDGRFTYPLTVRLIK